MKSLEELQHLIAGKVDGFCKKNGSDSIYQPINYLMKLGGKRLRPVLSLMAANLFTDEIDSAVYPALATEIFHNFTLMHDDIMDNAPLRRGMPTVHEKWNRDVAILSGDAMLIQSYQLLMKTKPELLAEILQIFNSTALEVCEGQQLDMEFQSREQISVGEYMEMIRLKTSVLLAGSMKIGAIIGGADLRAQQEVYEFGIQIGLSFQLWDDYLDAFGDAQQTGKQIGGDILADKKTFLALRTWELADDTQRAVIKKFAGQSGFTPVEKIDALRNLYTLLGVDIELIALVEKLHSKGLQLLDGLKIEASRKEMLRNFAHSMKDRKS